MQAFNEKLQWVSRGIYKVFYVFATFTFAVLLAILLINVFSRNLLDGSIAEIEEGSRFIFTWMMFLGISIGVYYKKHLGVEFLVDLYPKKFRRVIGFISDILMIILFVVLTIYGFKYANSTMKMLSPIMSIPYGLVYLCVPLCGVFSVFYTISKIVNDICEGMKDGGKDA